MSLRDKDFATPVDAAVEALGHRRKVMVSASSFLSAIDIVSTTDLVALVPRRLVVGRKNSLAVIEPPFPVEGFAVGMIWHERTQDHVGQRWVRDAIARASKT